MKNLIDKRNECRKALIAALTDFVRVNGKVCSEHELNEFGLDVEDEPGNHVTQVLNLFDNGGCYFAMQVSVNSNEDLSPEINFCHHAFQCLYIVRHIDGKEELKYYDLRNNGIIWDERESESDHDSVDSLSLEIIERIIEALYLEQNGE